MWLPILGGAIKKSLKMYYLLLLKRISSQYICHRICKRDEIISGITVKFYCPSLSRKLKALKLLLNYHQFRCRVSSSHCIFYVLQFVVLV